MFSIFEVGIFMIFFFFSKSAFGAFLSVLSYFFNHAEVNISALCGFHVRSENDFTYYFSSVVEFNGLLH